MGTVLLFVIILKSLLSRVRIAFCDIYNALRRPVFACVLSCLHSQTLMLQIASYRAIYADYDFITIRIEVNLDGDFYALQPAYRCSILEPDPGVLFCYLKFLCEVLCKD